MIVEATQEIIAGGRLSFETAAGVMGEIMDGSPTPAQFGAFVAALSTRGETSEEIAGMATVMRARARQVDAGDGLVDTCGTGGDGQNTYNISTAAAFVVAGAGGRVAKHGNRAATSMSGSADVLEALGVKIDLPPEAVAECIRRAGVGFMFAQTYHPAMKFAAPLRREIGIRTVFNVLGPLTNPTGVKRQVLGVGRADLVGAMADVLVRMGAEHALVVHGKEGLDEVSISGPTLVADARGGEVSRYEIEPGDFGLDAAPIEAIAGGDPEHNAAIINTVLEGEEGPRRDVLLINAGAGIFAAGLAPDISSGVAMAAESIDGGKARAALESLVELSNQV
ncbi:MAG: anthranilate phosphoribosyltransferase [Chloroflexi bacterium]|nr:anthranilate phosphoribosyltransferase [Chloroflexota bacterium]MCY3937911.1 anthranilate phosphoribosyltransferase [Chloroflexota bacterium]